MIIAVRGSYNFIWNEVNRLAALDYSIVSGPYQTRDGQYEAWLQQPIIKEIEAKERKQETKWLNQREAMQALLDGKKIAHENMDEDVFRCLNLNGELVNEDGDLCDWDTYQYDNIGDQKIGRKFRVIE